MTLLSLVSKSRLHGGRSQSSRFPGRRVQSPRVVVILIADCAPPRAGPSSSGRRTTTPSTIFTTCGTCYGASQKATSTQAGHSSHRSCLSTTAAAAGDPPLALRCTPRPVMLPTVDRASSSSSAITAAGRAARRCSRRSTGRTSSRLVRVLRTGTCCARGDCCALLLYLPFLPLSSSRFSAPPSHTFHLPCSTISPRPPPGALELMSRRLAAAVFGLPNTREWLAANVALAAGRPTAVWGHSARAGVGAAAGNMARWEPWKCQAHRRMNCRSPSDSHSLSSLILHLPTCRPCLIRTWAVTVTRPPISGRGRAGGLCGL